MRRAFLTSPTCWLGAGAPPSAEAVLQAQLAEAFRVGSSPGPLSASLDDDGVTVWLKRQDGSFFGTMPADDFLAMHKALAAKKAKR